MQQGSPLQPSVQGMQKGLARLSMPQARMQQASWRQHGSKAMLQLWTACQKMRSSSSSSSSSSSDSWKTCPAGPPPCGPNPLRLSPGAWSRKGVPCGSSRSYPAWSCPPCAVRTLPLTLCCNGSTPGGRAAPARMQQVALCAAKLPNQRSRRQQVRRMRVWKMMSVTAAILRAPRRILSTHVCTWPPPASPVPSQVTRLQAEVCTCERLYAI